MFELAATAVARDQLRALRSSHPSLFAAVAARLEHVRDDPGGRARGRSFLLDDGRVARLATIFDIDSSRDLVLVWIIERAPTGAGRLVVIRAEFVD